MKSQGFANNFSQKSSQKLSVKKIKEILQEFDSYNLHKQYRRPKYFNPYFIYARRAQIQADLIDVRQLSEYNDGINYLLLMIDAFSRKIWVYPLKTKTALEVTDNFRKHINKNPANLIFRELLVDGGKEFFNSNMNEFLNEFSISISKAGGYNKVAIGERANKTIQILIYKYLTNNESLRYIDVLNDLIKTYNTRAHRTLRGMTPQEADSPLNEIRVRGILRAKYAKIKRMNNKDKDKQFKIGDIVRIKKLTPKISSEGRAYAPQYHGHYYVIRDVDYRLPRTMYHIKSMDTGEDIIGGFYKNELSGVKGDVWKIEKIIRTRGKGRKREHLVRWLHFGPRWDSWISDKDITDVYAE